MARAGIAVTGRRTSGLAVRAVTDRAVIRSFLENDRLLAAYAHPARHRDRVIA